MADEFEAIIVGCRQRMAAIRAELMAMANAPVQPLATFRIESPSDEARDRLAAIMAAPSVNEARRLSAAHCGADMPASGAVHLRRMLDIETGVLLWAQRRALKAGAEGDGWAN